jgi:hypothetical protein
MQKYARIAGVLLLLSIIGGGLGEFYIPSKLIVSGNATATANNIRQFDFLFRLGFASYLIEGICDVALSWVMYVLLRRVHKNLALLAAFFGLVSTAVFAVAELFYFAPVFILNGAGLQTFSPGQLDSLALLSLRFYGYGGMLFVVFYGIATAIRGYLIFQSGYLPKFIGVLLAIGGVGFILKSFTLALAPAYSSGILLLPMSLGGVTLLVWLLVKGIDVSKWEARAVKI